MKKITFLIDDEKGFKDVHFEPDHPFKVKYTLTEDSKGSLTYELKDMNANSVNINDLDGYQKRYTNECFRVFSTESELKDEFKDFINPIEMTKSCYFYNLGVLFDKNNKEDMYDCWNCNGNACKSDIANGLWCDDYGIYFDKQTALDEVSLWVENPAHKINSYGYIKETQITMPYSSWNDMYQFLVDNYNYDSINDAKKGGFIPFDYYEIIEDNSSYWEEPDFSAIKRENKIEENTLHIVKEEELDPDIREYLNTKLYGTNDKGMEK